MKQDERFIQKRDKAKKFIRFYKILGTSGTYAKLSGGIFNGIKNGDLIEMDYNKLKNALVDAEEAVRELKVELERIRNEAN